MKKIFTTFIILPLLGCNFLNSTNDEISSSEKQHSSNYVVQSTTVKNNKELSQNEHYVSKNNKVILDVPLIRQLPELRYGCEVTSTAMMLQYAGVEIDKMELFKAVRKDPDPIVKVKGDILKWGNPEDGFVGDMTGKNGKAGYAVYDKVIVELVNYYLPGRAINLTGLPFEKVLNHVENGYPVVIWTTGDYRLPDRPEQWEHEGKLIVTPLDLHVVVLVGFDEENVYLNDPLSGKKAAKVPKKQFLQSWDALKNRAVSYI